MPDIRIHREHQLGLPRARKVALAWADYVEDRFGMECSVLKGKTSDTIEFTRSGVKGRLIVAGDHFDLDAHLGLLLGAFARTIESEVMKNLEDRLAEEGEGKAAPVKRRKG
ncbi:MAG: polyhydroxyalkanoic acid system family protein [Burkholderiales bacterium]|nr:polyhydroxyalkanoic acid system family protein [Burkholderiales bacterium]